MAGDAHWLPVLGCWATGPRGSVPIAACDSKMWNRSPLGITCDGRHDHVPCAERERHIRMTLFWYTMKIAQTILETLNKRMLSHVVHHRETPQQISGSFWIYIHLAMDFCGFLAATRLHHQAGAAGPLEAPEVQTLANTSGPCCTEPIVQ